ncbi:hypothetical protein I5Q34_19685 [Streptomyces sp. AV19]|uniref:hypothetical protein n=1 Tax=Streptomyces sp. AV19 TaxID=2793068 RepID=UPI0018FE60CD|nr:hypothetical protein [Streptomyces sp. AV19]MBH1936470.1 hypothetical protein [Streptomyces sp. AV19]MDG4532526.1 hypothetical protein [Streptomyces sp. AV19]
MTEYGVFYDGECIEAALYSPEEAETARQECQTDDPDAGPGDYTVHAMCMEHRDNEQAKGHCDLCAEEYGD